MPTQLTTEEFIAKARAVHGDKYDYSKTAYTSARQLVQIACPEHGTFEKRPRGHLVGQGCTRCGFDRRNKGRVIRFEKFVERAREVHGNTYTYSELYYGGIDGMAEIKCRIHGFFLQKPKQHVKGQGCPKCGAVKANANRFSTGCWSASSWAARQNGRKAVLYLIELKGENEIFYKVGITFDIKTRFHSRNMPYKSRAVAVVESQDAKQIFKLEKQILRECRCVKYLPLIGFAGQTECFSDVSPILHLLPLALTSYSKNVITTYLSDALDWGNQRQPSSMPRKVGFHRILASASPALATQ